MSDYLSRAADRINGTNAEIRPALPSLFDSEKSTAENVTSAPSSPEPRNVEVERASNTGEKIAGAVSGIQERVASALALAPETPPVERAEKRKLIIEPKFDEVVPPKVRAGATELESSSEKSSSPERSDRPPRVAPSSPVWERSPEPKEAPPHSRATRSQAGVKSSDELPHEMPPQRSPQPDRPRMIERVTKDSRSPIPVTAISRRRAASLKPTETRNKVRSVDRESSSEQTIQVTIGRLEVRAVQSAPALPKPAPSSPRISLEEYLRSRNEGAA